MRSGVVSLRSDVEFCERLISCCIWSQRGVHPANSLFWRWCVAGFWLRPPVTGAGCHGPGERLGAVPGSVDRGHNQGRSNRSPAGSPTQHALVSAGMSTPGRCLRQSPGVEAIVSEGCQRVRTCWTGLMRSSSTVALARPATWRRARRTGDHASGRRCRTRRLALGHGSSQSGGDRLGTTLLQLLGRAILYGLFRSQHLRVAGRAGGPQPSDLQRLVRF